MLSLIFYQAGDKGYFTINEVKKLIAEKDSKITDYAAYKMIMQLRKRGMVQRITTGRYIITVKGMTVLRAIEPKRLK